MRTASLCAAGLAIAALCVPAAAEDEDSGPRKPLPEPRLVGPRRGPEKEQALKKYGGSSQTEKAVEAGLDWLARHQSGDGGWDADGFPDLCDEDGKACEGIGKGQHGEAVPCPFDGPISALATLAFLGHGHLPGVKDDPHAAVVEKALKRLEGAGGRWGLALATQALAEAEAMERKGRWREVVERNAQTLLDGRGKDGAWGYAAGFRKGSDVPYTALVVQALVTARDAGVELPDDFGEGVDRFLSSLELGKDRKKGRLAYLVNGRAYGYTPTIENAHCAAALRELLETGRTGSRHRAHMALVAKRKPSWSISYVSHKGRKLPTSKHVSMYRWWYGTVATFQAGGSAWSSYFGKAKGALVGNRSKSGCSRGSWEPVGVYEKMTGGRVFATALGVLILEQPYRHRRLREPARTKKTNKKGKK